MQVDWRRLWDAGSNLLGSVGFILSIILTVLLILSRHCARHSGHKGELSEGGHAEPLCNS